MPHVEVDPNHCAGHALCSATAPEVYDLDDDGYCLPNSNAIDARLRQDAVNGAAACPERALTVIDD